MRREPTFTVEAIDPHKVTGYHKVWIHVGINSLKRDHCRNMTEVKHKFDIFMKKVNEIKFLSPNTKVIVSPILPTAIPELNSRALYFNSLLFAQKRQWGLLGFDAFCDSSGLLTQVYRRFSDRTDRIHLGFRGINLLTSKLRAEISLADGRSFAAVVATGCVSEDTHPVDPSNPLKYRRNGGGVLIAVNVSLSLESKVIPTKCAAELLAVELIFPNKSKVILATCYRVGTLGIPNCKEILEVLGELSGKKMLRKFIVIGYFNLNGVSWATGGCKTSVEKEFTNGFANLGLLQCINEPTHKKGNTLDILLTKSFSYIKDLKIIDTERYCISTTVQ